jgi:hypothetical protein
LCGDEARFLEGPAKLSAFMDRKCLAARFLSPLIDVLYRSGIKIQDQPLNLSLQLHFIPYLRTNSLHQKLGIALVLNCWARMFRRAFNAQKQQVSDMIRKNAANPAKKRGKSSFSLFFAGFAALL